MAFLQEPWSFRLVIESWYLSHKKDVLLNGYLIMMIPDSALGVDESLGSLSALSCKSYLNGHTSPLDVRRGLSAPFQSFYTPLSSWCGQYRPGDAWPSICFSDCQCDYHEESRRESDPCPRTRPGQRCRCGVRQRRLFQGGRPGVALHLSLDAVFQG